MYMENNISRKDAAQMKRRFISNCMIYLLVLPGLIRQALADRSDDFFDHLNELLVYEISPEEGTISEFISTGITDIPLSALSDDWSANYDGSAIYIDRKFIVLDTNNQYKIEREIHLEGITRHPCLDSEGKIITYLKREPGDNNPSIRFLDTSTGQLITQYTVLKQHREILFSYDISADANTIAYFFIPYSGTGLGDLYVVDRKETYFTDPILIQDRTFVESPPRVSSGGNRIFLFRSVCGTD